MSTTPRSYLDYNASAPMLPCVADVMIEVMGCPGNASSVHQSGRSFRRRIEDARAQVARSLEARSSEVIFTSGGTEANALALAGSFRGEGYRRILTSAIEHPSVMEMAASLDPNVGLISVTPQGVIDLDALDSELKEAGGGCVVSVMLANNETGALQPIAEVRSLAREHDALLHVDAVQAFGKIPVSFAALGADMMSVSAHKIGGPQGVGALVLRDGFDIGFLQKGGGQETGRRAGTENTAGIAGFGVAAQAACGKLDEMSDVALLRDSMEVRLKGLSSHVTIFCEHVGRLPNTSFFSADGLSAETLVIALDLDGLEVSSGSACSSGKVGQSRILEAMDVPDNLARGAIRVSLGHDTKQAEVDRLVTAWEAASHRQAAFKGAA